MCNRECEVAQGMVWYVEWPPNSPFGMPRFSGPQNSDKTDTYVEAVDAEAIDAGAVVSLMSNVSCGNVSS